MTLAKGWNAEKSEGPAVAAATLAGGTAFTAGLNDYYVGKMEEIAATCDADCGLAEVADQFLDSRRQLRGGPMELQRELGEAAKLRNPEMKAMAVKEAYRRAPADQQVEQKKNNEEQSCSATGTCLKPIENPDIINKKPIKQADPTKEDPEEADTDLKQKFPKKNKEGNVVKDEEGKDVLASTSSYYDTVLKGRNRASAGMTEKKRSNLQKTVTDKMAAYGLA